MEVASWDKVNIPHAEQRTWQGAHTSLLQGEAVPPGLGHLRTGKGGLFYCQAWPGTLGLREFQARTGGGEGPTAQALWSQA